MSEAFRIQDMVIADRPRERLAESGADALRNGELLAILLRTGTRGRSALDVADDLLSRHDSLSSLASASLEDLQKVSGIGRDKAIALRSAFTLAKRLASEVRRERPVLDSPEKVAELMREEVRERRVEIFEALLLDTRRRLIRSEVISHGTLDTVLVHPREVFRAAISANASALILVHNHPSGDPTPSRADITVTRELIRAGNLLKVEVLDHVILGHPTESDNTGFTSLRAMGYFSGH